ncbi:protein takeout-like [Aphomia sociella]
MMQCPCKKLMDAENIITPCSRNDDACLLKSAKAAYPLLIEGTSLGIESSDPVTLEEIDGSLSILNYKFTNTSLYGLKDCKLDNLKLNLEQLKLQFRINCDVLNFHGDYNMNGRLIILPVQGIGKFNIKSDSYKIGINAILKVDEDSNGKHMTIKNFKLNFEAVEKVVFDFKNLFNGQKDLSDTLHKFANENWSELANEFQETLFNPNFKRCIKHINKYLKNLTLEQLFSD